MAPNPKYRLADHVRACLVEKQVILLDLRRNKYMGVGGPQLPELAASIADWPNDNTNPATCGDESSLADSIKPFIDMSMLAETQSSVPTQVQLDEPVESLNAGRAAWPSGREWQGLLRLWWSSMIAAFWLRRWSLEDIVHKVSALRRKQRTPADAAASALQAAVAAYMQLRPFAFTAHDRCLHDSLSLLVFLASKGLCPTWVIGVRARPFAAHSWVQSGGVVLNDLHENVRQYRPILVV